MSAQRAAIERATVRGSVRLALGTIIALPTTMTFLALSVVIVVGRSVAALGARMIAHAAIEERE